MTNHIRVPVAALIIAAHTACLAQAQPDVYADPQNLKVLPADISPAALRATMKGFSIGTGLRCSECHVGEEGQDFSTYDFASDEKEHKRIAREMAKMVQAINSRYIAELGEDEPVQVECVTCHRGVPEPKLTGQVLAEAGDEGGAGAVAARWKELRAEYYGTHSYDFSELTLLEFARARFAAEEVGQARAALGILIEEHPDSLMGHVMLGQIDRTQGNVEAARGHFRRALEIDPNAGWVRQQLEALEE